MLALPALWLIPVICVQSRSALAGAVAAALLLLAQGRARNLLLWVSVGPGRCSPLLVPVHGRPERRYSWGLITLIAYLAFWAALLRLMYSRFPGDPHEFVRRVLRMGCRAQAAATRAQHREAQPPQPACLT
jgi:hypothetical protein